MLASASPNGKLQNDFLSPWFPEGTWAKRQPNKYRNMTRKPKSHVTIILIYWTWAIHRHMTFKSAPENCSKIWEERSTTTNTIPSFVASFCKHVMGARRQNFIGYTYNQGSKQCKWHFQIYTVSSSKFTVGTTLSQH